MFLAKEVVGVGKMEKERMSEEERKELEDYQTTKQSRKMYGEHPPIKGVRSKNDLKTKVIMDNAARVTGEELE